MPLDFSMAAFPWGIIIFIGIKMKSYVSILLLNISGLLIYVSYYVVGRYYRIYFLISLVWVSFFILMVVFSKNKFNIFVFCFLPFILLLFNVGFYLLMALPYLFNFN